MFLQIPPLTTKMGCYFLKNMFEHYPADILRYDVLEGFVGERCGRIKYDIGDGLGKCLVHDNVGLTGFFMEEFSHIRDQKLKKVF